MQNQHDSNARGPVDVTLSLPDSILSPMSPRDDAALQDLVTALWGNETTLLRSRRSAGRPAGTTLYGVIPRADRPRLLVPMAPRRVASQALRHYPTSKRTVRVLRVLAGGPPAPDWGPGSSSPARLPPSAAPRHLSRQLADAVGVSDVRFSVSVDLERPHCKPTLRLMSDRGRILGFAKVGWNDLTRGLVRKESEVLERLHSLPTATSFDIPRILATVQHDDLFVLVLSPLGGARGPGPPPKELPVTPTAELASLSPLDEAKLTESDYWLRLTRRVTAHGADPFLTGVAAEIESRYGATPLTFGLAHGDWVPWNMGLGTRVSVWDWERASFCDPAGFDAAHFLLQVALHWENHPPEDAVRIALQPSRAPVPGDRPEQCGCAPASKLEHPRDVPEVRRRERHERGG